MMSRKNLSTTPTMSARELIETVVLIERRRGTKILAALWIAAEVLGIPHRRVKSYHYGETVNLDDAPEMLGRFYVYLQAKIAAADHQNQQLRTLMRSLEGTHDMDTIAAEAAEFVVDGAPDGGG